MLDALERIANAIEALVDPPCRCCASCASPANRPLAAVYVLAFAGAGFWVGVLLAWKAFKPAGAKVN
jgi:hypothetical protein